MMKPSALERKKASAGRRTLLTAELQRDLYVYPGWGV